MSDALDVLSAMTALLSRPSGQAPSGGMKSTSSFWIGLQESRLAVGRDPATGTVVGEPGKSSFLGAIGYMCLLDLIGKLFNRPSRPIPSPGHGNPSFKRCLKMFTNLGETEVEVLYAVRNALVHDYSLMNGGRNCHLFEFRWGDTADLVFVPIDRWNGEPTTMATAGSTIVNLSAFVDLAEHIAGDIVGGIAWYRPWGPSTDFGDLELAVTPLEAQHRYLIWHVA